jgi:hypothetical protein
MIARKLINNKFSEKNNNNMGRSRGNGDTSKVSLLSKELIFIPSKKNR